MKKIIVYENINGNKPYSRWLNKLQKKNMPVALRIIHRLEVLERKGHYGDYKHLQDGVFELRYNFGAGYRLYFAEDGDTIVVLLCAGDKSTQSRDISKALDYWADYQKRYLTK